MKPLALLAAGLVSGFITDKPIDSITGKTISFDQDPDITGKTISFDQDPGSISAAGPYLAADVLAATETLERKELVGGKLVLQFRRVTPSTTRFAAYVDPPGPPDVVAVWRETYGVSNGIVVLEKTEHAKVIPQRIVTEQEKVEWPK